VSLFPGTHFWGETMTPDTITDGSLDRPLVAVESVVHHHTVVDNLRVGGVVVIDPADPLLLRPGERLRLVVDQPGWAWPASRG
jgi:hypothetical protein